MASSEDINVWISLAKEYDATHLIIICDEWDGGLFPVYAHGNKNYEDVVNDFNGRNMCHVARVYAAPFIEPSYEFNKCA